jgi:integrase
VGLRGYTLSSHWEGAISGWQTWLKTGGMSDKTRSLRRDHVRTMARRSKTLHPRQMTLSMLVELCREQNWSDEHRRGVRTSLISFSEWCVLVGLMDDNPAVLLPSGRGDQPNPCPAPDHVWHQLIEAAPPRERLMARLAGEAGMRRAEIAECCRGDLVQDSGGWSLVVKGKGHKHRVVPVGDDLAHAIRMHCDSGYLFPGQIGGHISAGWVGTVINQLMPPGWTMHRLRYRFATIGHAGTGNLVDVQEALCHTAMSAADRYNAVSRDEIRAACEAATARNVEVKGRPPDGAG